MDDSPVGSLLVNKSKTTHLPLFYYYLPTDFLVRSNLTEQL